MSRIGKQPVVVPSGVTVTVNKDNQLIVKGPKGELKQEVDRDITIEVKDGQVIFNRPTDQIRHRALHGLYRSLVDNMVRGVTEGFKKNLELVGVGFKASTGTPSHVAACFRSRNARTCGNSDRRVLATAQVASACGPP